jgi:hypothetical protein
MVSIAAAEQLGGALLVGHGRRWAAVGSQRASARRPVCGRGYAVSGGRAESVGRGSGEVSLGVAES